MELQPAQIRAHRLRAHHLDQPLPLSGLLDAAGACGLQNSPPGAWETALFQRVEGCALPLLHAALFREKTLLQAWSFRGAPVVFPTAQSGCFLSPLAARDGEAPWIYTAGVAAALDWLHLSFEALLPLVREAARCLDDRTIVSKEALDQTLAALVAQTLSPETRALWDAPSMYGRPDRQTVGGAAVSFLLRPLSFESRVVFGERQGVSPSFTSYRNWVGHAPETPPDADKALMRKFLHCYGPATPDALAGWLGCSRKQAQRLWSAVEDELTPVTVGKKTCYLLARDLPELVNASPEPGRLLLLGAHDPYLDCRDKTILLPNTALHRIVWRTVANPGAVLKGGRIVGIWRSKTQKTQISLTLRLFEPLTGAEQQTLRALAENYAAFRALHLQELILEA